LRILKLFESVKGENIKTHIINTRLNIIKKYFSYIFNNDMIMIFLGTIENYRAEISRARERATE